MDRNEAVIISSHGEDMAQNGESLVIFVVTKANSYMIIWGEVWREMRK